MWLPLACCIFIKTKFALRHHWLMPISCHIRDCKVLLVTSLTHVSGAIASVQTFTFIFITPVVVLCSLYFINAFKCCQQKFEAVTENAKCPTMSQ